MKQEIEVEFLGEDQSWGRAETNVSVYPTNNLYFNALSAQVDGGVQNHQFQISFVSLQFIMFVLIADYND